MVPQIAVSRDRMGATLVMPAGAAIGLAELRDQLTAADVHAGLEPGALLAATRISESERTLVVARGRPPRHGADGRVELLIDEPVSVYGAGTVDLHELHHFREVVAGAPIARLIAPDAGEAGWDVHGQALPAKPGRESAFGAILGPGCVVDEHDESLARAEIGGIYQRFTRGGRPFIQIAPEVRVPGDVDMTIGNISSQYPVVVAGDVHTTFQLKSQASITVVGSIEDARVSARGDLVVKGGILQGAERVKAHGDLTARHIESREVKCRHLHVDYAIHFARIRATGHVTARDIMGGEVLAAGSLTCDTLGDPDGRPTLVQVGVNPFEEALVVWARGREDHLDAEIVAARERCRLLAHRVQTLLSAGEDHTGDDRQLRQALLALDDLRRLDQRCRAILAAHPARLEEAALLTAAARITVRKRLNPGTILRIGDGAERIIREPTGPGMFFRAGDQIAG